MPDLILNTPASISFFRLCALRSGLKLECLGLRRHGRSCFAIVKAELGFKGTKQQVLEQLSAHIKTLKP